MTKTTNLFRSCVSALALAVLMCGFVVAVHGQERARSAPVSAALTTSATWLPTGNLWQPRAFHTATLLLNGKVLVAGGNPGRDWPPGTTSAELYDPTSATWSPTGSMSTPRVGHTATLLPSGKVLVVSEGTAEIYDPVTGSWSLADNTATGSGHTATLLQNGKVLVVGGYFWRDDWDNWDVAKNTELFDPATGKWSPTGNPVNSRYWHTATLLNDGKVLIAGGSDVGWYLATHVPPAELYDPVTETWTMVVDGGPATVNHTATVLPDANVLVAGGHGRGAIFEDGASQMSQLFDPAIGRWTATGKLGTPRYRHSATRLATGEVLIVGGSTSIDCCPRTDVLASAELYDPSTGAWASAASLSVPRSGHSATLLQDGAVLIAGGGIGGPLVLASAELYGDFTAGTISPTFTGSWYDPAQSGHGLLLEVLPDNRFLAAWFAFNPAGTEQAWFLGTGSYSGNTATIDSVVQPTGGRFIPNFDPARVVNNPWGTLTFTFTDCNHGRVNFSSTRGYGTGSMNLTRLTELAGPNCSGTGDWDY